MDVSEYHIATKRIHELEQELEQTTALCKSLTTIVNEGMHWLPMSDDAVFEDEVKYIIRRKQGYVEAMVYNEYERAFYCAGFDDWLTRGTITHYARITEPK